MEPLMLIGIALGLAMDAFAVAVGVSVGLGGTSRRQMFRLAWHFGLFQALMPIIGWAAGTTVRPLIEGWDHWIAFALLTLIGGKMIVEALRGGAADVTTPDPTRGWTLVGLSVATSIDALAVGLSFAALGIEVWFPAAVIGLTAGAMTVLGTLGGRTLGLRLGNRMSAVGGIVLILIGYRIVYQHLGLS